MNFLDITVRVVSYAFSANCPLPNTSLYTCLQDDALLHICSFLDTEDLISFESACHRTRKIAAHLHEWSAWRQAIVSRLTLGSDELMSLRMRELVDKIVDDVVESGLYRKEEIEKRLVSLLDPGQKTRLLMNPLAASSYDFPEENLSHVINPVVRTTKMLSYWSSRGSDNADDVESVSFTVYPPVALITRISIRPFSAWFQRGCPIYPPQKVRFTLGGIPLYTDIDKLLMPMEAMDTVRKDIKMDSSAFHISLNTMMETPHRFGPGVSYDVSEGNFESNTESDSPMDTAGIQGWCPDSMRFVSQEFLVESLDQVQHFDLPTPALCINGYLKIDLVGKVNRQEADMKYYTCLGYVGCEGYRMRGLFYHDRMKKFQYVEQNEEYCHEAVPSDSDSELFRNIASDPTQDTHIMYV